MSWNKVALMAEYSRLYDRASEIIKRDNPCQITKDQETGKVECARTRAFPDERGWDNQLCCSNCRHLGPNGCTVEALSCRVWACYIGATPNPKVWPRETADALLVIAHEAAVIGIPLYARNSKEETFNEPLSYTGLRRIR